MDYKVEKGKAVFPEGIKMIEKGAFANCEGLVSAVIPNTVKSICDNAFEDCTKLRDIVLPKDLTFIGNSAFRDCSNLNQIDIPDTVAHIGSSAFMGCDNLEHVKLPRNLTDIEEYLFSGCKKLRKVDIPMLVTKIKRDAFAGCESLEDISIPDVVVEIRDRAFAGCKSIKEIKIPAKVRSLGRMLFGSDIVVTGNGNKHGIYEMKPSDDFYSQCDALESIFCFVDYPLNIGFWNTSLVEDKDCFLDKQGDKYKHYLGSYHATLYVPKEYIDLFRKTAPWKNFSEIREMPEDILSSGSIHVKRKNEEKSLNNNGGNKVMATQQSTKSKIIPEELDELIQEFLTDGILTAKEREVVLKKAEKKGLDRDEIDLYLDAQVQKIDQATDAAIRRQKGKSCPHCGAYVPQLTDKCPECGQFITPEATQELAEILDNLEGALIKMKSRRDFDESKAIVERYSRKARLYYSNNPKIKSLLAEVDTEMTVAEKNFKSAQRKEALVSVKDTSVNVFVYLMKNKWFWVALPMFIGIMCIWLGEAESGIPAFGFIVILIDLLALMFVAMKAADD